MAMKNPRVSALRIAAKAFLIIAAGGHLLPEEGKTFADLCCLAIPMKDRFTRQELADISNSVRGVLHVERHVDGCECDKCGAATRGKERAGQ
jgi:hypothetical protein